jgi:alkanesulfonate monooxygenase SsuD/methylene tetrahydromethanopterin reductase-like flavin-dependent oxidoreductase (luciferase family)
MQFGVFDHMDASGEPLAELFENRLRLAEAYDRIGLYALHVAEHHSTPLGMSPSPSVFLALAAQRTKRLRLGPLVYTLPLYHPLRLAEEICTLDQLSGGRLELVTERTYSWCCDNFLIGDTGVAEKLHRFPQKIVELG